MNTRNKIWSSVFVSNSPLLKYTIPCFCAFFKPFIEVILQIFFTNTLCKETSLKNEERQHNTLLLGLENITSFTILRTYSLLKTSY